MGYENCDIKISYLTYGLGVRDVMSHTVRCSDNTLVVHCCDGCLLLWLRLWQLWMLRLLLLLLELGLWLRFLRGWLLLWLLLRLLLLWLGRRNVFLFDHWITVLVLLLFCSQLSPFRFSLLYALALQSFLVFLF